MAVDINVDAESRLLYGVVKIILFWVSLVLEGRRTESFYVADENVRR